MVHQIYFKSGVPISEKFSDAANSTCESNSIQIAVFFVVPIFVKGCFNTGRK